MTVNSTCTSSGNIVQCILSQRAINRYLFFYPKIPAMRYLTLTLKRCSHKIEITWNIQRGARERSPNLMSVTRDVVPVKVTGGFLLVKSTFYKRINKLINQISRVIHSIRQSFDTPIRIIDATTRYIATRADWI